MYLCFIDESGSPPKRNKRDPRPYFVIAGVIMHEAQWHGIDEELKRLKGKVEYAVRGEIKWRYFGAGNDDDDNSVKHLTQAQKDAFRREFYSIISSRKSIKTIACVTSVASAYEQAYVHDEEDLYMYTYKAVSERFQYYLQDQTRLIGQQQLGIVVADHRGKSQDDSLRKGHRGLVDRDSLFTSKYDNYVETLFLTPSHLSVGIQFADMVAGAVGRKFNSKDETFYAAVEPTFRRSPAGKIEGFGLARFPTANFR